MSNLFAAQELPRKRTGRALAWLNQQGIWKFILIGIILYLFVVLLISGIEYFFHIAGHDLVFNNNSPVDDFCDILYFNFITILTVGYGDFHPKSYGKFLSVIEAFVGVGLFSVLVAIVTVKSLLPPRDTIVFSRYAYYCTEPKRFLIIFVNTSNTNLGNAEISSYFKLGGDWGVRPSVTSPFITQAVQTFHIDQEDLQTIIAELKDGDCLRVGITGGIGFTSFSTSIQYHADKILVIQNRDELTAYDGFWKPDFTSPEFQKMFHYKPANALTLEAYVKAERGAK